MTTLTAYGAVARHLITYADNPRPEPQTTSAERTRRCSTPIIRRFDRISVGPVVDPASWCHSTGKGGIEVVVGAAEA